MINYSITARAVNPNLFEINQAKTRINQAKAEGKQPDPKDEALVETVVTNYFATAQYTEVMTIEKFARHIADHGTTYSRADIMAILYMAVDCMREQLLEGKKIRLGELGDFSVALSSKGAETAEKFSTQTVQATPKTGFAFDKWSDGSTQNPRTVKLTSDLTLTASFKTATTGGGDQGSGEDQGGGTLGD